MTTNESDNVAAQVAGDADSDLTAKEVARWILELDGGTWSEAALVRAERFIKRYEAQIITRSTPSQDELERRNATQAETIMELEAEVTARTAALNSARSALSYVYHRERSRLTEETQQHVFSALGDVERVLKSAPATPSQEAFDVLRDAAEANLAWSVAEDLSLGSFQARMELCSYSQWLTRKALGELSDYEGIPRLLLDPALMNVELARCNVENCKALVREALRLAAERKIAEENKNDLP